MFSVFTAGVHRSAVDGRYALFMASFTIIIVMDSTSIYLANLAAKGGIVEILRPYIEIGGASLMIAALPRFTHSFSEVPIKRALNIGFLILALVSGALGFLWAADVLGHGSGWVTFAPMIGTIVYSLVSGRFYDARWPQRGLSEADIRRWDRIMGFATVLTIVFIPLFIFIDFFPRLLPFLTDRLPPYFRTYPFFFLLWNLVYVIRTLPTYRRKEPGTAEWRFELSPREREVALHLLEGLSYREIAEKLHVSLATVKTHVNRIYDKTGAGNKMELARMLRG